jgi:hypothetical protein
MQMVPLLIMEMALSWRIMDILPAELLTEAFSERRRIYCEVEFGVQGEIVSILHCGSWTH